MVRITSGMPPLSLEIQAQRVGSDLVVVLSGGTRPHVGATAVAQPRPSLRGDGSRSATASVITLLGHKEDELARWAALTLAARLGATVVVSAGIHVDDATPEQIRYLEAEARALVERLAHRLETEAGA